jgi:hypothetical protein
MNSEFENMSTVYSIIQSFVFKLLIIYIHIW